MGASAREVALRALTACARQGAWSDGFLKKALREAKLDGRDAALATRLCFGTLQNRILLDFYLAGLCTVKLERLEEPVLECLRLGAYQILCLDRVPDRAAVCEAVALARKVSKHPKAPGLVNGVLRNLSRQKEALPEPPDDATRYSHPTWLAAAFAARLGKEGAADLMEADNSQPAACAQVNTYRFTAEQVRMELEACGVEVQLHPWMADCLLLRSTGDLERLEPFQKGAFYIQDPAAKLAVLAAEPRAGMRVLDACAAPGGKSFAAAVAMKNMGHIISCDIHPHKQRLITAGALRLGLDCIQANVWDAKACKASFLDEFDLVIVDVPCSGLGIIRKKPDIRYKEPAPLKNLPDVQRAILENTCRYVKPGGRLLYATCTLLERENEAIVTEFLDKHKNFTAEEFQLPPPIGTAKDGMLTLWPHIHGTDGFFMARLRRKEHDDGS